MHGAYTRSGHVHDAFELHECPPGLEPGRVGGGERSTSGSNNLFLSCREHHIIQ